MAKNSGPILKRCRSLDIDPTYLGYNKKSKKNPNNSRRKVSEYGLQLKEKQKAKFVYGERMSIAAQKILIRHRIQHKEGKLVGEILTPDNTDVRPCDKAVQDIKKAKDAYSIFNEGNGALN